VGTKPRERKDQPIRVEGNINARNVVQPATIGGLTNETF